MQGLNSPYCILLFIYHSAECLNGKIKRNLWQDVHIFSSTISNSHLHYHLQCNYDHSYYINVNQTLLCIYNFGNNINNLMCWIQKQNFKICRKYTQHIEYCKLLIFQYIYMYIKLTTQSNKEHNIFNDNPMEMNVSWIYVKLKS